MFNVLLKTLNMTALEFDYGVRQHKDKLLTFANTLTADRNDAEDLLQETFYKALTYRNSFKSQTNLKAWLYTIMRNTFINDYRRKVRFRHIQEQKYESGRNENLKSETPLSTIGEKDILEKINALPDDYKMAFTLYINGFKYKEIAEELDIPIGTIKSRIFSARKILMDQLKDYNV